MYGASLMEKAAVDKFFGEQHGGTQLRARRPLAPTPPDEDAAAHAYRIADDVPWNSAGVREIGFDVPQRYNASDVLFRNLDAGRGARLAVTGPSGPWSYAQLCADAVRWGNGLLSLGLTRGDRVLLFLDDTPVYPAAFFGAVRAGLVPLLINLLTPPDLLRFYITDSAAKVAISEADFCDRFAAAGCEDTPLQTLLVANGEGRSDVGVDVREAAAWLSAF